MCRTFGTKGEAEGWAKDMDAEIRRRLAAGLPVTVDTLDHNVRSHRPGPNRRPDTPARCGVYFLYKGSECVYVGKSTHVDDRVADHRRIKDFDAYSWMPVEPESLAVVEMSFIAVLRPRYNVTGKEAA